jgi:hypothetical protein
MSEMRNAARLSRLPERPNHPLFRPGYDLGYSDRAQDQHLAEIEQNGLRLLRDRPPAASPSYGADAFGLRDHLTAGASVVRELPAVTGREVVTEVPCCGRRITIPVLDGEARAAACYRCGVLYTVTLAEEEPDGYNDELPKVAVFVVEHVNAATAQHRAGRWGLLLGPRPSGGGT